jgi:protein-tyrosine phosphatase
MNRTLLAAAIAIGFSSTCLTENVIAQVPRPTGDTAVMAPRIVPLEGVQNFRDIGGYRTSDGRRVKWGLIYRSAELSRLTPQDLVEITGLNIQSVHDLRSLEERRSEPTAWTGTQSPRFIAHDYTMDMAALADLFRNVTTPELARDAFAGLYPHLLDIQQPQEAALFEDLLKAEGATLYHCTAGKDRTGLATALILSALGVPRDIILYDYELSNRFYDAGLGRQDKEDGADRSALAQLPADVIAVFMSVDARYLRAVFDRIESEYGTVEAYLDQKLGVDAAAIARLRHLYTE